MTFRVYEERIDKALDEAMATLNANRDHVVGLDRFDWLYRQNPDGEAVLWSIRKEETGEMVGFTVCLPRRMLVDGQEQICWNGADFSVHRRFRTLGIAAKLRRAAKEAVDAGRVSFLYAHPNARMQIVHERVGHTPVGTMIRYAKPLRSEPYLKRRLKSDTLSRLAAMAVDPLLGVQSRERRHRFLHSTQVVQRVAFDDRFDSLFEQACHGHRLIGVRDAKYLDWRYHQNPLYDTHAVLAEIDGRLLGYALFVTEGTVVHVKDIFAGDRAVELDLVARLIKHVREEGFHSISAGVLEGHPVVDTLLRFGFHQRPDNSHMVAYAPQQSPLADFIYSRNTWLISVGDRDL